ncbi:MAG: hypothetical protein HUK02_05495 [Bacteroidaceae bacterium]|nr:hypothetical protein [Bacteroidaceae bacterium]
MKTMKTMMMAMAMMMGMTSAAMAQNQHGHPDMKGNNQNPPAIPAVEHNHKDRAIHDNCPACRPANGQMPGQHQGQHMGQGQGKCAQCPNHGMCNGQCKMHKPIQHTDKCMKQIKKGKKHSKNCKCECHRHPMPMPERGHGHNHG